MAVERIHIGWRFWIQWLLATTAGWAAGLVILVLIPPTTNAALVEGASLTLAGTLAGIMQWLVLRRWIHQAGWWIPATAAGWAGGLVLFVLWLAIGLWVIEISTATDVTILRGSFGFMIGLGVGVGVGVMQWLVLRRQIRQAGWWVLISALGWIGGFPLLTLTAEATRGVFLGSAAFIGALIGAITGAALILLSKPLPIAFISLRVKLMAAFSFLVVAALGEAAYWIYDYAMHTALDHTTQEIETLLRVAAAGIDGDDLVALYQDGESVASGLADDPRYLEQLHWLETARGKRPYVLYTLVRTEEAGEVAFVVNTRPADDPPAVAWFRETQSPPEDSPVWQGFVTTTVGSVGHFSLSTLLSELAWQELVDTTASTGSWHNQRGAWISGYTPVRNARGEIVASLGVDLPAAYASEVQPDISTPARRILADAGVPILIAAFLIAQAIVRPLADVTRAARGIGRGEYEQDLSHIHDVRFDNEITNLAEAIEESARAHISERRLRREVEELKIQINEAKRRQQVEAIVEDDFFQDLQAKAQEMRTRRRGKRATGDDQEA